MQKGQFGSGNPEKRHESRERKPEQPGSSSAPGIDPFIRDLLTRPNSSRDLPTSKDLPTRPSTRDGSTQPHSPHDEAEERTYTYTEERDSLIGQQEKKLFPLRDWRIPDESALYEAVTPPIEGNNLFRTGGVRDYSHLLNEIPKEPSWLNEMKNGAEENLERQFDFGGIKRIFDKRLTTRGTIDPFLSKNTESFGKEGITGDSGIDKINIIKEMPGLPPERNTTSPARVTLADLRANISRREGMNNPKDDPELERAKELFHQEVGDDLELERAKELFRQEVGNPDELDRPPFAKGVLDDSSDGGIPEK